ncbi:MAG TPA: nuclear transport factor 2 family protein [Ferruginibacter sp.]|nr:nuclear transport factor 2 family protein [Ferruginibacter sp.]
MKKILLLLLVFIAATFLTTRAQTNDEAAVRACLEDYMSGDGNRMEKAFHTSASMKYIDGQTGEFKDVPIADFIARVKANTNKTERKIGIESVSIEGDAASGKIKIETEKVILYDYMNMLKINGEWKIVSKIFSRRNK